MENELRFYLGQIKRAIAYTDEELDMIEKGEQVARELFKPQYIVTATKLPTGAIELAVNTSKIPEKIEDILAAYDNDMHLKTDTEVVMQNIMVV